MPFCLSGTDRQLLTLVASVMNAEASGISDGRHAGYFALPDPLTARTRHRDKSSS